MLPKWSGAWTWWKIDFRVQYSGSECPLEVTGAIGYIAETSHYQQCQEAAKSEWMLQCIFDTTKKRIVVRQLVQVVSLASL